MSSSRTANVDRRIYFFLSYAHVAPADDGTDTDTDHWVRVFYEELHAEVARLARPEFGMEIGFYDPLLPPGSDWKALLANALGATEVFVPLYSPGYLNQAWPMSELDSFRQRLDVARHTKGNHVQPVLWVPLAPWSVHASQVTEALELGSDMSVYAENGLRAMRKLGSYEKQYWAILRRLARRIVTAAERTPLGPSRAPVLREITALTIGDTPFLVAVIAPTTNQLPPTRQPAPYGTDGALWRPFTDPGALPVARYTANVAERLGLPVKIVDVGGGGRPGTGDETPSFEANPAVLLIDPWVLARKTGRSVLSRAIDRLHRWVTPVVVIDERDPQYERGASLAAEVLDMFSAADVMRRTESVRGLHELVQLMPVLISQTRRRYLRYAPVFPPKDAESEPLWTNNDTRRSRGTRND
jgi:FxsC-like protein